MGKSNSRYNKLSYDELLKELRKCKANDIAKIKYIKQLLSLYELPRNDQKNNSDDLVNLDQLLDQIIDSPQDDILDQIIDVNYSNQERIDERNPVRSDAPVDFNNMMTNRLLNNINLNMMASKQKLITMSKPYAQSNTVNDITPDLGRRRNIV